MAGKGGGALVAIRDMISGHKTSLSTALGAALDVDRLAAVALREIAATPALLACTPLSLFQAIHRAATMGLMIGEGLGHAYLVPFGDKAQLIPGYRGLAYLAVKCGAARSITAHVVYQGDELDLVYGRHREGTLRPGIPDRGEPIGAIAFAELPDEQQVALFMSAAEIQKTRAASRAKNADLWTKWWEEAWAKTVIRKLVKRLPVSISGDAAQRLGAAMSADGEFAEEQPIDIDVEVKDTPAPKSRTEEARERIGASPAEQIAQAEQAERPPEPEKPKPAKKTKAAAAVEVEQVPAGAMNDIDEGKRSAMMNEIVAIVKKHPGDPRSPDNKATAFVQQFCRDAGVPKIAALDDDALEQLLGLLRDMVPETLFQ